MERFLSRHTAFDDNDAAYTPSDTQQLIAALSDAKTTAFLTPENVDAAPRAVKTVLAAVRSAAELSTPEQMTAAKVSHFAIQFVLPSTAVTIPPPPPPNIAASRFFLILPAGSATTRDTVTLTIRDKKTVCMLTPPTVLRVAAPAATAASAVFDTNPTASLTAATSRREVRIRKYSDNRVVVVVDAILCKDDASAMFAKMLMSAGAGGAGGSAK